MKIKTFVFNPVEENTYVIYDDTKEGIIIDGGCFYPNEKEAIEQFITQEGLTIKYLLNTHLHFDHCLGLTYLAKRYNIKLYAHEGDATLLSNLSNQASRFGFRIQEKPPVISKYIKDQEELSFGNTSYKAIHVPGHSAGSLCFYFKEGKTLFSGDVLFRGSIGRTDLPTGNYEQLITGIKTKLLDLPGETTVYTGHGDTTTIAFEKKNNYYLSK